MPESEPEPESSTQELPRIVLIELYSTLIIQSERSGFPRKQLGEIRTAFQQTKGLLEQCGQNGKPISISTGQLDFLNRCAEAEPVLHNEGDTGSMIIKMNSKKP